MQDLTKFHVLLRRASSTLFLSFSLCSGKCAVTNSQHCVTGAGLGPRRAPERWRQHEAAVILFSGNKFSAIIIYGFSVAEHLALLPRLFRIVACYDVCALCDQIDNKKKGG